MTIRLITIRLVHLVMTVDDPFVRTNQFDHALPAQQDAILIILMNDPERIPEP